MNITRKSYFSFKQNNNSGFSQQSQKNSFASNLEPPVVTHIARETMPDLQSVSVENDSLEYTVSKMNTKTTAKAAEGIIFELNSINPEGMFYANPPYRTGAIFYAPSEANHGKPELKKHAFDLVDNKGTYILTPVIDEMKQYIPDLAASLEFFIQ